MQFRAVLCAAALALATTLFVLVGGAGAAGGSGKPKLSKEDRAALADARANGVKQVTLLIAAKGGAVGAAADGVTGLGGGGRRQPGRGSAGEPRHPDSARRSGPRRDADAARARDAR
jgi:hypothetical protein